jgi:hypothetical protein
MSLFDKLLGRRPDPTQTWGAAALPIPDYDLSRMCFGTLQFGDALDAAAFLGRPERFEWTQAGYCELLYASGGFQIDYDHGRFAYLAFFIGPDDNLPKHAALEFSKPCLRGSTPDGIRLSRDTERAMLEQLFGVPESVDSGSQETILHYTRHNVSMEFEMDGQAGRLKRWNLYPK